VVGGAVLELEGSSAHLSLLVVDPQVQRRGLGRTLLEHCERHAREAGCTHLRLEVREGNRSAIAFYRQCGYTQTHERRGYYGEKESALCFSRTLL
jgi:ribosomal protein S18 acetylase RimI-like enzyme